MPEFLVVSSLVGATCFGVFTVSLLIDRHRAPVARWLLAASSVSTVWFLCGALYRLGLADFVTLDGLWALEVVRDLAWFSMCFHLLGGGWRRPAPNAVLAYTRVLALAVCAFVVLALFFATTLASVVEQAWVSKAIFAAMLALSVIGLSLVEQLYRNTTAERRWAIKYFCLGLGAVFVYDFVLFADGVLFNRLDPALWAGRGAANALAVPLIAISAARNREWKLSLFLSRQFVFHGTALLGVGVYLLVMAAAGYYLRAYGGEWGSAMRAVFLFAGGVLLVTVVGSAGVRARLRLFLGRHFYREKYDYGEVWLSFTNRLSQSDSRPEELRTTMLRAIADVMEATGGVMWQRSVGDAYRIVAHWEIDIQPLRDIPASHPLVRSLVEPNAVIDVRSEAGQATVDGEATVPAWVLELPRAWLLMPIVHRDELLAVVMLCESRAAQEVTWEDRRLLGTLGRQAAGYLALMQATEELGNARQFEAFNRLSAFLVHDLKNVIAQLSLVLRNSERHRANPEFIADAFNTIGDAVAKMNRMIGNLKHTQAGPTDLLDVAGCVQEALDLTRHREPVPSVTGGVAGAQVMGNRDRFIAMIEHLIQNAQEATRPDGKVAVTLSRQDSRVMIEITDDGCGMTQDFIQNRLFKPFDTTKGKAGMGIGVYESLHVVNVMGGRLSVDSTPGQGTSFQITFPLAERPLITSSEHRLREVSA
ncbi:MAG: XrtA/PEP-CTERM system histidine kinase PrsK [Gammaproteobacteria bacterium]